MADAAGAAVTPASTAAAYSTAANGSHSQTHYYRVVGVKKGHYLAVRSGANSSDRIVGYVKADATATGTGKSAHGYLEVKASNGRTGWAPAKNLQEIKVKSR